MKQISISTELNNRKAFIEYSDNMQDVYKILKITGQAENVMYQ